MNIPSFPAPATDDQASYAKPAFNQSGADPLASLMGTLKSRRWLILGIAAVLMAISFFVISRIQPIYTASALVLVEENKPRIVDMDAVVSGITTDPSSLRNQIEIIKSRAMAERVVRAAGLLQDPEFGGVAGATQLPPAPAGAQTGQEDLGKDHPRVRRAIGRLLGKLEVKLVGGSVFRLSITTGDSEKSARIANAYADAYLVDQLTTRLESSQRAQTWLAERLGELADDVRRAEEAVERYKVDNGITEANGTSLVTQQVAELNRSLVAARTARAQEEVKLRRIEQVARRGGNLATVSEVAVSPLIAQLRGKETEARRRKAELATRYGAEHPNMINVDAEIRDIQAGITAEISRVVESVRSDVEVARAKERSLERSLAELEGRLQIQNSSRIELRNLEAVAATNRAIYDSFVARMNETQQQEGMDSENVRVLSAATPPGKPSYPNKPMLFTVAVVGALGIGIMIAIALDALDAGFRTAGQAEATLQLPVLSTIPEVQGKNRKSNLQDRMVVDKPLSNFSESIRSVQSALSLSNVDEPPQVVLLTSSLPKEGKTTIAVNLARHHATRDRKVLLIDGDLRRPMVAETLGIETKTGIVEVLAGEATLAEAIIKDDLTALDVLPVHQRAANPSHLLDSETIRKLITDLRSKYDHIVIDSAPILPVNDSKFLSKAADVVLFVLRWEKTTRDAAREGVKRLKDIDAPLAGLVFSRADSRRHSVYAYGYQYRYGESAKYYHG